MDWLWFFYLFQSCYRLGLTSEPVTTGSYSSRRMTAKLNAALRLQLCSSSSSCSPGQADFEKKSQICLLGKLQPHQWSHLDWRLLNSSVNQVSCPCLLLGYTKLATSAQSVQWQLPWIKELHFFFYFSWHTVPKHDTRIGFRGIGGMSALPMLNESNSNSLLITKESVMVLCSQ